MGAGPTLWLKREALRESSRVGAESDYWEWAAGGETSTHD